MFRKWIYSLLILSLFLVIENVSSSSNVYRNANIIAAKSLSYFSFSFFPFASTVHSTDFLQYSSTEKSFSILYPDDLVESPKLLKTHNFEVFFKSNKVKGFNAGVTVDPVKITTLKDFGVPSVLAVKVETVEKSKEGVTNVIMQRAEDSMPVCKGLPAYELEYVVDSSRGLNHYLVKTTIVDKNLYVFTIQAPEATFPTVEDSADKMINSLHIERELQIKSK